MNNPVDEVNLSNTEGANKGVVKPDIMSLVNDTLELKDLLAAETQWLKRMEVKKVEEVHERKLQLIRRLEIQKELLKRDSSSLGHGTEEEREYLQTLQHEMQEVTQENFIEVTKAREINKRVVDIIASAVTKHENRATGYGHDGMSYSNNGKQPNFDKSYAVSVNQTI